MNDDTQSCFVIGPIGNSLAPHDSPARKVYEDALEVLENVIIPACAAVGIQPIRADSISVAGDLTEQIFKHLRDDDVVIADLTGANPNVMYELGLRHTVDKLTIQIGEFDSLPFDVSSIRTIQFSRSAHGLIQARKKLTEALTIGLADGGDPLLPTRLWSDLRGRVHTSHAPDTEVSQPSHELESPLESEGLIELIAVIEESFPDLTVLLSRIGESIVRLGSTAETFAPDVQAMNSTSAPPSARLALVARFAKELEAPAMELDGLATEFAGQMQDLDGAVGELLSMWEEADPPGPPPSALLEGIIELATSSKSGIEGLSSMVPGVRTMAKLSRTLQHPARLIDGAVARLIDSVSKIDSWGMRSRRILKEADS